MPRKPKRPSVRNAGGVWVSADLALKLKGPQGSRGLRLPQSPFLDLADHFLGEKPAEHLPVTRAQSLKEPVSEAPPAKPPAAPGKPKHNYPKPPAMKPGPKPARLALPKPPLRPTPPKPPRLQVPKLPKRKP